MGVTVDVKVDLSKMEALRARIKEIEAKEAKVRIGVFSGAGDAKDKDGKSTGITLATLAAIHEYGSEKAGLPERSFLRATFRAKKDQGIAMCGKVCKAFIENKISLEQAMGILGEWGVAQVKNFIRSNQVKPPSTEATNEKKGSSVTLVDTAQLVNSISYESPFGSGAGEGNGDVE